MSCLEIDSGQRSVNGQPILSDAPLRGFERQCGTLREQAGSTIGGRNNLNGVRAPCRCVQIVSKDSFVETDLIAEERLLRFPTAVLQTSLLGLRRP